jgi:Zn-dependent peptidase ImmA (M78 family)
MPVDALRRSIDRIRRTTTSFGPKTVERLAGEFGVSESSMHFRLINLGLYIPH